MRSFEEGGEEKRGEISLESELSEDGDEKAGNGVGVGLGIGIEIEAGELEAARKKKSKMMAADGVCFVS